MERLRIDVTDDSALVRQNGLRDALGVPYNTQPYMAFVDGSGARREDLDLTQWHGTRSREELAMRVDRLH